MENKVLKQINKAYNKRVNKLNKELQNGSNVVLEILLEQLKRLRDILIVQATLQTDEFERALIDEKITPLVIAISEFEAYQKSEQRDQKDFHWNTFWEFVKLNMEEWLLLNDTI